MRIYLNIPDIPLYFISISFIMDETIPMKVSLYKNKLLIIVAGVLTIIALNFYSREVRSFFYSISAPIQKAFWKEGQNISDFFGSIIKSGGLEEKINNLELENQKLLSEIILLNRLREENVDLRAALGIGLEKDFNLELAEIIAKNSEEDYVLINRGADSNLKEGMPVITESKALCGKISEVYGTTSKVSLISEKKTIFEAEMREKEIKGEIQGDGNSRIIFKRVAPDKEITEGDLIVTTSLSRIFPKDLLVGKVNKISGSDIKYHKEAEISPLCQIEDLNRLLIITNF